MNININKFLSNNIRNASNNNHKLFFKNVKNMINKKLHIIKNIDFVDLLDNYYINDFIINLIKLLEYDIIILNNTLFLYISNILNLLLLNIFKVNTDYNYLNSLIIDLAIFKNYSIIKYIFFNKSINNYIIDLLKNDMSIYKYISNIKIFENCGFIINENILNYIYPHISDDDMMYLSKIINFNKLDKSPFFYYNYSFDNFVQLFIKFMNNGYNLKSHNNKLYIYKVLLNLNISTIYLINKYNIDINTIVDNEEHMITYYINNYDLFKYFYEKYNINYDWTDYIKFKLKKIDKYNERSIIYLIENNILNKKNLYSIFKLSNSIFIYKTIKNKTDISKFKCVYLKNIKCSKKNCLNKNNILYLKKHTDIISPNSDGDNFLYVLWYNQQYNAFFYLLSLNLFDLNYTNNNNENILLYILKTYNNKKLNEYNDFIIYAFYLLINKCNIYNICNDNTHILYYNISAELYSMILQKIIRDKKIDKIKEMIYLKVNNTNAELNMIKNNNFDVLKLIYKIIPSNISILYSINVNNINEKIITLLLNKSSKKKLYNSDISIFINYKQNIEYIYSNLNKDLLIWFFLINKYKNININCFSILSKKIYF